jgi:hypothetical protein
MANDGKKYISGAKPDNNAEPVYQAYFGGAAATVLRKEDGTGVSSLGGGGGGWPYGVLTLYSDTVGGTGILYDTPNTNMGMQVVLTGTGTIGATVYVYGSNVENQLYPELLGSIEVTGGSGAANAAEPISNPYKYVWVDVPTADIVGSVSTISVTAAKVAVQTIATISVPEGVVTPFVEYNIPIADGATAIATLFTGKLATAVVLRFEGGPGATTAVNPLLHYVINSGNPVVDLNTDGVYLIMRAGDEITSEATEDDPITSLHIAASVGLTTDNYTAFGSYRE